MNITVNSYFSGAGLMDVGLQMSGVDVQQSFEIDAAACATHRLNTGHSVLECDITNKLAQAELPCRCDGGHLPLQQILSDCRYFRQSHRG